MSECRCIHCGAKVDYTDVWEENAWTVRGHKIRNSDSGYTIKLPYDFVKPLIDTKLINYSYYKDGEFTIDGIDYCYKCGVDLDHDGHDVGSGCDPEWRCREWKQPQICPKCGEE